jgi:hypothetical protein
MTTLTLPLDPTVIDPTTIDTATSAGLLLREALARSHQRRGCR